MSQRRKRVEAKLGAFFFRRLQRRLAKKDVAGAEEAGARLGRLVYRLSRKHRERALMNLQIAFPEWSEEERRRVAQGVLEHFGRTTADFMRASSRTEQEVLDSVVASGQEILDAAFAKGKGVILITGHFGNWERMANWLTLKGYRLSVVARDANQPELNVLVTELREAAGVEVLSRGNAARGVLTRLRKNEMVGILPDQNSGEAFIPFFGKPAGTVLGPAVLAARTGAQVIPAFCPRVGVGKYRVDIFPALEPLPDYPDEAQGMMASINLALEHAIREFPEQYLWIHDRWKSARLEGLL